MANIYNDIDCVLITKQQLEEKVAEIAEMINCEYMEKNPLVVCILKGSVIFFADLCKLINCNMQMDFMVASSYEDSTTGNPVVNIKKDLEYDINGRDVIIIEDIIDSGRTLYALKNKLLERHPASLKIITLLDKPDRRLKNITIVPDFCGFVIPDKFVVGYGLDFAQQYRNMPYIGVLKEEIYNKK